MKEFIYKPIGTIHTPFEKTNNMPIQPSAANGIDGTIDVFPEYEKGLKDLYGFSHIILIYHFHLSTGYKLEVKPFLDENIHGVFATRAPRRPNNIGVSVVKLLSVVKNILYIQNVDIVNGTPLLDIKPYISDFDAAVNTRIGWLKDSKQKISNQKSDDRFNF